MRISKHNKILPVRSIGILHRRSYALHPVMYLYDNSHNMLTCVKIPIRDIFGIRAKAPAIQLSRYI